MYTKAKALADAAKRVSEFDEIDRRNGNATPQSMGLREVVATSAAACTAALTMLERKDIKHGMECVADAVVMLARSIGQEDLLR